MFVGEQNEEGHTHGDGGHQIWQKGHTVDIVCPFTSPVFGHGIADEGADGARQQGAAHADPDGPPEGVPDGLVMQDALLAVHAVFGDVLAGDPPLGGEIFGVPGVQEGVIPGVGQEGLKGEGDNGEDAGEEGDHHQDKGDDIAPHPAQVDLGDLAGLAGDGGVVFAGLQAELVEQHDGHAEDHHDDGQDAGLAGVLGVHGHILGGQGGQAQVVGHGVGAHGAAEHQQDGGQNGGLDHGQGDPAHDLPLGGVQNGGRLLQVSVHVAEDAADEDIGEGGIVQSQHHHAGEQALAPPDGHGDAGGGGQQTVGRAGDGVGVEQVLPHHGQGPLGHDIGEDEDGA